MKKALALLLVLSLLITAASCRKEKSEPQKLPVEIQQEVAATKAAPKEPKEAIDNIAEAEAPDATEENPSEAEEAPLNPASMQPEADHTWEEDAPPAL